MITKKQLKQQLIDANNRIVDLEDRLCLENGHKFIVVDTYRTMDYNGIDVDFWHYRILKCKTCGKVVEDSDHPFCDKKYNEYVEPCT